jgi:ATP adenylyltransferase/5',5'''-P-1,P-4-tetraphosphate phosphorylase II
LDFHFTLPLKEHTPQLLEKMYADMLLFAKEWHDMAVFYNGAKCGASAPDHAHLQAVRKKDIPLLADEWRERVDDSIEPLFMSGGSGIYMCEGYVVPLFQVRSGSVSGSVELMRHLLDSMQCVDNEQEPRMNVVCCYEHGEGWTITVIPRSGHRPTCYSADGVDGRMVSPGTLDMAGLVVTPLQKDFDGITADEAVAMLREVAIDDDAFEQIVENIVSCHEEC